MSAPGPGNGKDRLDSWKEIVAYFRTTERTVQRWEETEGLPVHRRLHRTKHSVHAYRAELEQWWASRLTARKPEREEDPLETPPVEPAASAAPKSRRYWIPIAALVVILTGLVSAALWIPGKRAPAPSQVIRPGRLLANLTREARQVRSISVGGPPITSILTPDESELYVAQRNGVVSVIDTAKLDVTHRLKIGGVPVRFAVSPDGLRVYVANEIDNVQVIDTATKTWKTITVGGRAWDVAVSPGGRRLFVTMGRQGLKRIMTDSGTVETVPGLVCPVFLAVDARSNQMWVSCRCGGPGGRPGHDWVDVLDLESERSVASAGGPPLVGGLIALSPDGSTVWIDGSDACLAPGYDHVGCPAVPSGVVHAIRSSDRSFIGTVAAPGQSAPIPGPGESAMVLATGDGIAVVEAASFKTVERWDQVVHWVSFTRDGHWGYFSMAKQDAIVQASLSGPACEPVRDGLNNFWSGDGIADDVAGATHGRLERGTGFAPGLIGQAFSFDGDDDHVQFGLRGAAYWDLYAPATLGLWVKFARPMGREEVILERPLTSGALSWRLLRLADGRISFRVSDGGKTVALSTQTPALSGVWSHLTLANNGSQLRLYLNGVRQATLDYRLATDDSSTLRLGGASGGSFAGLIDEITMHSVEYTDEQILRQHQGFVSACVSPQRP